MISIIIPTLNEEKNLARLIDNIKNQDFKDFEIIVSDGNSIDKTKEIALRYNCKFISCNNRGPAQQRNNGVKLAKGEYLLFLDADSLIPNNFLTKSYNEFIRRSLDVASYYIRFNSKKIIYKVYNGVYNFLCFIFQYHKPLAVGAAILSKKTSHSLVSGFDENIYVGEDHDYATRIKIKNKKFRMIKSTYFYYSPRRWEKEGQIKSIFKIIKISFYMIFSGPIRKKIVEYEFGKY
jgi:glycosyltransferase involved in cell wall biosynthesis